jgi:hypothetical protein
MNRGVVRKRGVVARLALDHYQTVCGIVCNLWMHHCLTHSLSNETLASWKQCCIIGTSWVTNCSIACQAAATSMPGCSKDQWICCYIWTACTSLLDLPSLGQECLANDAGNAPLLHCRGSSQHVKLPGTLGQGSSASTSPAPAALSTFLIFKPCFQCHMTTKLASFRDWSSATDLNFRLHPSHQHYYHTCSKQL